MTERGRNKGQGSKTTQDKGNMERDLSSKLEVMPKDEGTEARAYSHKLLGYDIYQNISSDKGSQNGGADSLPIFGKK